MDADDEARQIWLRFLPAERVLPFGCKDNFWEMGATGPCGPCTEIHYDRIGDRDAASLVNADRPDCIEIWNLVFIQYNRESEEILKSLPAKHVDTGMGLERLTSILQDKQSNYDTDIFMPIFEEIQKVVGPSLRPYLGLVGEDDKDLKDMAYRVVADHIRALTFAITDGAVPSNDGRGYVLRRILRRAVRYGQEILGAPAGFFTSLVPIIVTRFSDIFPELIGKKDFVMSVIADEERSFNRTLDLGVRHVKKVFAALEAAGSNVFPGKDAQYLFGTMGFPVDLTQLMAEEKGFTVDIDECNRLMKEDREKSKSALNKSCLEKDLNMEAEQTSWLQTQNIKQTDSSSKYQWEIELEANVVACFHGRGLAGAGFETKGSYSDDAFGIILDRTSFYYESGGQIFDTGSLCFGDCIFTVTNCQTYAGYVVHVGTLTSGSVSVGDKAKCRVDYARRSLVAPNHTMTHVLNFALRKVLLEGLEGTVTSTCDQKGSLVDEEKLRCDFSWNTALTVEQIASVEKVVQELIATALPVYAQVVPFA